MCLKETLMAFALGAIDGKDSTMMINMFLLFGIFYLTGALLAIGSRKKRTPDE